MKKLKEFLKGRINQFKIENLFSFLITILIQVGLIIIYSIMVTIVINETAFHFLTFKDVLFLITAFNIVYAFLNNGFEVKYHREDTEDENKITERETIDMIKQRKEYYDNQEI